MNKYLAMVLAIGSLMGCKEGDTIIQSPPEATPNRLLCVQSNTSWDLDIRADSISATNDTIPLHWQIASDGNTVIDIPDRGKTCVYGHVGNNFVAHFTVVRFSPEGIARDVYGDLNGAGYIPIFCNEE